MSRRIEPRLAALERRAALSAFDPREVCLMAGRCYERGEPLPPDLTARERRLAETMLNALVMSEPERWFDRTLPLPMPSPPHVWRSPS